MTEAVHRAGGLVYGDGANLNAILGIVKPAEMGFDCLHINAHKTFSTPHGAGGPGAGPVVVSELLEPFLPVPVVARRPDGRFTLEFDRPAIDRSPEGLSRPLRHPRPRPTRISGMHGAGRAARASARRPC